MCSCLYRGHPKVGHVKLRRQDSSGKVSQLFLARPRYFLVAHHYFQGEPQPRGGEAWACSQVSAHAILLGHIPARALPTFLAESKLKPQEFRHDGHRPSFSLEGHLSMTLPKRHPIAILLVWTRDFGM